MWAACLFPIEILKRPEFIDLYSPEEREKFIKERLVYEFQWRVVQYSEKDRWFFLRRGIKNKKPALWAGFKISFTLFQDRNYFFLEADFFLDADFFFEAAFFLATIESLLFSFKLICFLLYLKCVCLFVT